MNKCEYCNNVFKSLKTLNQHKRLAKFCLIKQKKQLICEYCNDISYSDKDFEYHQNHCIIFLKSKNQELEEKIKELQEENKEKIKELQEENKDILYYQNETEFYKKQIVEKNEQLIEKNNQIKHLQDQIVSITKTAVSKPTTTNNNNINNKILNMSVLNLDSENVKNIINNNYNLDVICEGQKGVAKFATNFLLKDSDGNLNYVCTDASRKIFKYKNNDGELEKDINAQKLTDILSDNGIFNTTSQITKDHWTNDDGSIDDDKFSKLFSKTLEINSLKEDNTIFKNELIAHTTI
jgi:hypothetical protein